MLVKGDSISLKGADLSKLDNHQFFQIVYCSCYHKLCVHAFYYVKDEQLAEDIVQEVFLKAWITIDPLREKIEGVWENYLAVMTRNMALNIKKRKAVEVKRSAGYSYHRSGVVFNDWMQKEYDVMLQKAIKALPARQREVFVLNYYGFDTREISKELKIAYSTARNSLMYAVKKLEAYVNKPYVRTGAGDELMPAA